MTIISILQREVDLLVKKYDCGCPPVFVVSLFKDSIILSIKHSNSSFSKEMFPVDNMDYGLPLIEDIMENLYNRTM